MWPFRKRAIGPDQLPVEGPWSVAEGQHNGRVMFVRTNIGYREFGSVSGYAHQVGIAVPLREAETTGLPSTAEDTQLHQVEDIISDSLQEGAESLLVAVITTGGMREFVFYTREPQRVQHRFELLRRRIATHEMQLMIQPDKGWKVYAQFVPGE
ncbi:MAG: DUF695 domain-containing protein [Acidobacteriota bacterium]